MAAVDRFAGLDDERLLSPATRAVSITPSDVNDLSYISKRLWIGHGGNLRVTLAGDDSPVTYRAVPSGSYLAVRASRVGASGTSATDLIAEY